MGKICFLETCNPFVIKKMNNNFWLFSNPECVPVTWHESECSGQQPSHFSNSLEIIKCLLAFVIQKEFHIAKFQLSPSLESHELNLELLEAILQVRFFYWPPLFMSLIPLYLSCCFNTWQSDMLFQCKKTSLDCNNMKTSVFAGSSTS